MIRFLRLLLWPFSLLYGLIIAIRNFLYDRGIFSSKKFDLPVIVIGNLAVGGTGKSPLTEYLIRLLKQTLKVATLSRGYGRISKHFMYVEPDDKSEMAGDEPLQFKNKYPDVTVAVSVDRVLGVEKLKREHQIILLDDAFQHRALTPGFSILLLDYASLFRPRLLLPAGDFRDTYNQRKRANVIIVSKSPEDLSTESRRQALRKVAAGINQPVFFSSLSYGIPYRGKEVFATNNQVREEMGLQKDHSILLITGIANPKPLFIYIKAQCESVQLLSYGDHYNYSLRDIKEIVQRYHAIEAEGKYILTTEKDFQRLKSYLNDPIMANISIWVIPIEVSFNKEDEEQFTSLVLDYCKRSVKINSEQDS